jgi:hypothetical protein
VAQALVVVEQVLRVLRQLLELQILGAVAVEPMPTIQVHQVQVLLAML